MAAAGMVDPRFAGFLSTLGCTLTTQMALARAIGASESAQQSGKAQGVVNQCCNKRDTGVCHCTWLMPVTSPHEGHLLHAVHEL